jgi:hypothetical protein
MSAASAPDPGAAEPGVSNLIHLFADRFMPTAKGPLVYSRADNVGVKVETLATTLIAGAIWGLRENGHARLEQREEKKLGFIKLKRTHMWPAGPEASTPPGALDQAILDLLRSSTKHHTPETGWTEYDLTRALVPTVDSPYKWVVTTVLNDDAAKGYLAPQTDASGKHLVYESVAATIAALEHEASKLAQGWKAFTDSEPDMAKPLISHIDTAIHGREKTESDNS